MSGHSLNFLLLEPLSANLTVMLSELPGNLALSRASITFLQSSLFSILHTHKQRVELQRLSRAWASHTHVPAEPHTLAVARVVPDHPGGDDPTIGLDQILKHL